VSSQQPGSALGRAEWKALGTNVVLATADPSELDAAQVAVEGELAAIDAACSRFRPDSELSRAHLARGDWVEIGSLLFEAVAAALWAAEVTQGAVDPTVGRSMRILGYDRDFAAIPANGPVLASIVDVPGWRVVELDPARRRLKIPDGVELDLGATAKGLAADRSAAAALNAGGRGGVLVSLGGDVAVAGPPPEPGWPVLVTEDSDVNLDDEDPDAELVMVRDGGLATSSTTVRRWLRGAAVLHHIIDPATGLPVDGPWRTATVAAATCLEANAASTAAIVLGAGAIAWLTSRHLPARLVGRSGAVHRLAGWPEAR
jgi:thiamine biosynthesis lipoprotein